MAIAAIILAMTSLQGEAAVSINSAAINNVGLNEIFFRMGDNLMLGNSGMCLKGFINVSVQGMRGKRIFCMVEPIVDGSMMQDSKGDCNAIYAIQPTSANYTGKVAFALPYSWMGISFNDRVDKVRDLKLQVSIIDFNAEKPVIATKTITLDQSNTRIDPNGIVRDGDGFIDPSSCRKCSQHPGICRRCHGKGEEEVEIRESGGWFF